MSAISQTKLSKLAAALCLLAVSDLGSHTPATANAIELTAGVESSGVIRMPIEKVALQFTQVDAVSASSASIEHGKVTLNMENTYNYGYIGEFHLGSGEPQKIRAMFDTGSANSWIRSKESNERKNFAAVKSTFPFDHSKSPTWQEPSDDEKQWTKISFGSGALRGYFGHDQCVLGDMEDPSNQLVLGDYMFGLVIEDGVFQSNFDAIVGMAYPEFAEKNVVPFFDCLMKAGILEKNAFAFHMSLNPEEEPSELVLGGWDESRYSGDLVWHPVQHKLFWSIQLDDVLVDGKSLGYCGPGTGKTCYITPDSGTSLMTFPSWAYNQFMASEHGKTKKCKKGEEYTYGDLTFVVNGVSYDVPSHHWNDRTSQMYGTDGDCKTTIQKLDVGQDGLDDLFIAGDLFMQLYYAVFDRDNDRVGLAPAAHTHCEKVSHFNAMGYFDYVDEVATGTNATCK